MNTDEHGWSLGLIAYDIQSIRRTLRQRTPRQPAGARTTEPAERAAREKAFSRTILCAACRHVVTSERDRMATGGGHEHRFFNPHGFLFHIGCFRGAPGCLSAGEASLEFTWFPGYSWRLALCRGCLQHLGWRFENVAGDTFFGLVLNRLVIVDSTPRP